MTPNLEQAIQEVQKLPAAEQDAIASIILDELADEKRWDESFARSQDQLGRLAAKVRADIRAGRIRDTSVEDL
ncbi:MAG TPA: hypothetical protein VF789_30275 [Thermoanaerobaculia bacterium]